jgi:hypothetical protein
MSVGYVPGGYSNFINNGNGSSFYNLGNYGLSSVGGATGVPGLAGLNPLGAGFGGLGSGLMGSGMGALGNPYMGGGFGGGFNSPAMLLASILPSAIGGIVSIIQAICQRGKERRGESAEEDCACSSKKVAYERNNPIESIDFADQEIEAHTNSD